MTGARAMPVYEGDAVGGAAGAWVGKAVKGVTALDKKSVGQASAATQEMLSSARSGGFRISENAAQGLRNALRDMQGRLDELRFESQYLAEEPQLGTHDYGKRVAAHDVKSADGDRGVISTLQQLKQVVSDADEALKIAVENYRKQEDDAQSTFGPGQGS